MPTTTDPAVLAQEIAATVAAGKAPPAEQLAAYRAATTPKRPAGRTPLRNFRLDDATWDGVTEDAEQLGITASDWIRGAIRDRLEHGIRP